MNPSHVASQNPPSPSYEQGKAVMVPAEPLRRHLLKALRRSTLPVLFKAPISRAVADPLFPLTYFIRNVMVLLRDKAWRRTHTSRGSRVRVLWLLKERCDFFLEVRMWREAVQGRESLRNLYGSANPALPSEGYCTHCGGCCELLSGFPDFPEESLIPERWKRIFGDGLGRGHRFCSFLWEVRGTARSLCAIHPWRSRPCRTFGDEECDFVLNDSDFLSLSKREPFMRAFRALIRFVS